ncbi:hypothetical protein VTH06DRAFT_1384, partial [Thermothelomyces fergusii]
MAATTYLPRADTGSTSLPPYTPQEQQQEYELEHLRRRSSGGGSGTSPSILSVPPPPYTIDDATAAAPGLCSRPFRPTVHLQIQALGKPWFSLPLPPRPDPIPVFAVPPTASDDAALPWFTSFRPERCSGSCYLQQSPAAFSSSSCSSSSSPSSFPPSPSSGSAVVATTTYRFGPGRPPVVRLFSPARGPGPDAAAVRRILFPPS